MPNLQKTPPSAPSSGKDAAQVCSTAQVPCPAPSASGKKIADKAKEMIGTSTAGIPGTDGGNLGCASAVSSMFKEGTGQDIIPGKPEGTTSTVELNNSLANDPRFEKVPMSEAQPGDIIVTPRKDATHPGHTGIVGDDGAIISNSSSGYNGSKPGTIQQNYTVDKWKSSVSTRNPGQTGVYRYKGS